MVVDESSMMVFPHFLSLATLVDPTGSMMLAGDHRQLSPIVAHDWEREDRPPTVLYQPHVSAYQAVQDLTTNGRITDQAVRRSALNFTFRLPHEIRHLIARVYRDDDIELLGRSATGGIVPGSSVPPAEGPEAWQRIWQDGAGLILVLHSERESRRSNEVEARIVHDVLDGCDALEDASIAVMSPHRAQRGLLTRVLERFAGPVDVIDTVERLQGGERPTVIVSATGQRSGSN